MLRDEPALGPDGSGKVGQRRRSGGCNPMRGAAQHRFTCLWPGRRNPARPVRI